MIIIIIQKIINSKSFRRLNGKTQVFTFPENVLIRNRLIHTLEVKSIAETIATILGLNISLVGAIAAGHDLGHTPFGHLGERFIQKNYDEWAIKPDGESAQTLPMGRVSSDSGVESAHTEEVESVHTEKVESVQPPKKTKNKKQFARARASNIICTQDQPISQPAFPHDCYSPQSVKIEIEILRNIGLKNPEIKNHLIMRGIAEAIVDKALGKDF